MLYYLLTLVVYEYHSQPYSCKWKAVFALMHLHKPPLTYSNHCPQFIHITVKGLSSNICNTSVPPLSLYLCVSALLPITLLTDWIQCSLPSHFADIANSCVLCLCDKIPGNFAVLDYPTHNWLRLPDQETAGYINLSGMIYWLLFVCFQIMNRHRDLAID